MPAGTAAGKIAKKLFMNDEGKFSIMRTGGSLFTAYSGIDSYEESRQQGNGVLRSAIVGAGDLALGVLSPGLMIAKDFVPAMAELGVDAYNKVSQYGRQLQRQDRNTPFQNATFVDSQQTYTMRQAGMNLARQGQYAAQQTTMGNEASSIAYNGL